MITAFASAYARLRSMRRCLYAKLGAACLVLDAIFVETVMWVMSPLGARGSQWGVG